MLTPTSSADDGSDKTPVQSTPGERPQSQYKAYVPPGVTQKEPVISTHRQTMSFHNTSTVATPLGPKNHDEIFFGTNQPQGSQSNSRSASSEEIANVPVPAPLSFTANRPLSTVLPSKMNPIDILVKLLPTQITPTEPSHLIDEIRNKSKDVNSNVNVEELTRTWEKSASLTRKKNDDARRKRQEDNEEHNNDLFDSNEISYAEISQLEEDLREHERKLKAQEDRDEYQEYVETIFDKVYNGIQDEIKTLMDLYIEAENLLHTSISGVRSLQGSDMPTTMDSLSLLRDLHEQIERNHTRVHLAVAERDKRYKKTETQPLYAAGNITKMKVVERHFEVASAQALARAKSDSAWPTSSRRLKMSSLPPSRQSRQTSTGSSPRCALSQTHLPRPTSSLGQTSPSPNSSRLQRISSPSSTLSSATLSQLISLPMLLMRAPRALTPRVFSRSRQMQVTLRRSSEKSLSGGCMYWNRIRKILRACWRSKGRARK
jgi:hypothetical protein